MKSDNFIVLVSEDDYLPDENNHTTATIPSDNGWMPPAAGEKVVVGVISVKLSPNSSHKGQLKNHKGTYPVFPENPGRDLNRKHYDSWGDLVASTRKQKHCDGHSIVSMIVVHPAYWRRGHGTRMAQWAAGMAKLEGIPQVVSSAPMSEPLFRGFGYECLCRIVADGDEDDPEGVSTALLEYCPAQRLDVNPSL